jgi:hypothetical protein
MPDYLAHVVFRPNDGGKAYTVETQFKADSFVRAFEHIQGLSRTFDGAIMSHRISEMKWKGGDTPPLALPPPPEAASKKDDNTTLPGNVIPAWCGVYKPTCPDPIPFPQEYKHNATVPF